MSRVNFILIQQVSWFDVSSDSSDWDFSKVKKWNMTFDKGVEIPVEPIKFTRNKGVLVWSQPPSSIDSGEPDNSTVLFHSFEYFGLLTKVKYKQNFHFFVKPDSQRSFLLEIKISVPCSRYGNTIEVVFTFSFMATTAKGFYEILREKIHSVEKHEADEALMVGGKRLYDPHEGDENERYHNFHMKSSVNHIDLKLDISTIEADLEQFTKNKKLEG